MHFPKREGGRREVAVPVAEASEPCMPDVSLASCSSLHSALRTLNTRPVEGKESAKSAMSVGAGQACECD